ncbi:MAG: LysR family transcriptional regulator [Pseudorhodoplanes sp.]|uniref:LysR family transcriptional regulator n=1 Tax=Pseudorhodoplanes sp. TaxID=1934341 RepID=UPI003D0F295F
MDLKQITYFTWTYEARSFTAAAKKANIVQPALSMQIKRLEQELGLKLFKRNPAGIQPTPAADQLYKHCNVIIGELADARERLGRLSEASETSGRITVGVPPALTRRILAPVLVELLDKYPKLEVSILEAYSGSVVDWVKSGKVDFALGASPPDSATLKRRLVCHDTVVLVSSRPINGTNFSPCDLAALPALKLIFPANPNGLTASLRKRVKTGEIAPERIVEIDSNVGSMELARTSDWALISPLLAIPEETSPQLYVYPITRPKLPFPIYLLYDQARPLTKPALRFLELLKERLRIDKQSAASADGTGANGFRQHCCITGADAPITNG